MHLTLARMPASLLVLFCTSRVHSPLAEPFRAAAVRQLDAVQGDSAETSPRAPPHANQLPALRTLTHAALPWAATTSDSLCGMTKLSAFLEEKHFISMSDTKNLLCNHLYASGQVKISLLFLHRWAMIGQPRVWGKIYLWNNLTEMEVTAWNLVFKNQFYATNEKWPNNFVEVQFL